MVGIKSKFLLASGVMVALAILLELSLAAGDIGGAKIAVDGTKSSEDDEILSRLDHLSLSRIRVSTKDLPLRLRCSLYEESLRSMLGDKASSDVTELFDQVISALSKRKLPFGNKNPFLEALNNCFSITNADEGISKPADAEIAEGTIGDTSTLSTSDSPQELLLDSEEGSKKQIGETEVKLDPVEDEISAEQKSSDEKPEVKDDQPITTAITPSPTDDPPKSKIQDKSTKEMNKEEKIAAPAIRKRDNEACNVFSNIDSRVRYNYRSSISSNTDCKVNYNDESTIVSNIDCNMCSNYASHISNNIDSKIQYNRHCTVINCQDCTIYNNTGIKVINRSDVTITGQRN